MHDEILTEGRDLWMTRILVDEGIFTYEGEIVGYSYVKIVAHWKVNRKVMGLK